MTGKCGKDRIALQGAALIVSALLLADASAADAKGLYLGGAIGLSQAQDEFNQGLGTPADDKDGAWKLFGGYDFGIAAVELSKVDFGKFTAPIATTPGAPDDVFEGDGLNVTVFGRLPISERFSISPAVGVTKWEVEGSFRQGSLVTGYQRSGTSVNYGIGATYEFDSRVGVRLDWQRYAKLGEENSTGRTDVDVIWLNFFVGLGGTLWTTDNQTQQPSGAQQTR